MSSICNSMVGAGVRYTIHGPGSCTALTKALLLMTRLEAWVPLGGAGIDD